TTLQSGLTTTGLAAGDLTLNGIQIGASVAGTQAGQTIGSAYAIAQAINAVGGQSGVTAVANPAIASTISVTGAAPAALAIAANTFSVNGISVGAIAVGVAASLAVTPPIAGGPTAAIAQGANTAEAINKITAQTGVRATVDDLGQVKLTSLTGKNIELKMVDPLATAPQIAAVVANTGLTVTVAGTVTSGGGPAVGAVAAGGFRINGVDIGAIAASGTIPGQGANAAAAVNLLSGKTGVTASADAITGAITLSTADGRDIKLENGTSTALLGVGIVAATFTGSMTLQSSNVNGIIVGGTNDKYAGLHAYEGMKSSDAKSTNTISSVDVSTASGALASLATIDAALTSVNTSKAALGAYQNRFTAVVSNLQATAENLAASRSRIQDADFAAETASLTRGQILQQAGTAMLAQANSLPNGVLALLRG
ncbi:MAG: flagellin, partial [Pseudomonadota bacterium]